jgi:hypothetical protein
MKEIGGIGLAVPRMGYPCFQVKGERVGLTGMQMNGGGTPSGPPPREDRVWAGKTVVLTVMSCMRALVIIAISGESAPRAYEKECDMFDRSDGEPPSPSG